MPKVTFVNQSARDSDNIAANPARLLNVFPVGVVGDGRTTLALKSVLGQDAKDSAGNVPVRAMGRGDGKNWLAADGKLFEVASDGTLTERGAISDDPNTTISGNFGAVTIVAGGLYYVWDGATISQPTTKTFTHVGSHCYVGGFTVITERDGKRFQWSSIGDAESLNALDFASAEKVDDNIIRAVEFRGNLLLFCETSTEIWSLDPNAPTNARRFVFSDVTNTGLKSFNLLTRFDDALFFIGNDNRAYIFGQGVVSTPSVKTDLARTIDGNAFSAEFTSEFD